MRQITKVLCLVLWSIVIIASFQLYRFHRREQQQAERKFEQGVLSGAYQIKWPDSLVTFRLDPTHLYHQQVVLRSGKTLDNYGVWKFIQGAGPDRGKDLSHYEDQAGIELQQVLDPTVDRDLGIPYGKCYYRISARAFYLHTLEDKSNVSYPPLGKRQADFRGTS